MPGISVYPSPTVRKAVLGSKGKILNGMKQEGYQNDGKNMLNASVLIVC
jgi:hypothetical protein